MREYSRFSRVRLGLGPLPQLIRRAVFFPLQTHPGLQEEKSRCQPLLQKLSHIKSQIPWSKDSGSSWLFRTCPQGGGGGRSLGVR